MVSDQYVLAVPQGTRANLDPEILEQYQAYEIQEDAVSLMNEVAKLPWDKKLILPIIPGLAKVEDNKAWEKAVGDCVTALKVSWLSNDRLKYLRLHNAFDSSGRFLNAQGANVLPMHPNNIAFVVGLGPSLGKFVEECGGDITDGRTTFVAWSASNLFKRANFIGHCDPRDPKASNDTFEHGQCFPEAIIATPGACPSFLDSYKKTPLYAYYSDDSPIDSWFCEKTKTKAHPAISGTVTHMLTKAAVLAGYKKIVLVGCELSFPTRSAAEKANNGRKCMRFKNARGETIWSPEKYATCRWGFDALADEHSDVQFYNYSDLGIQFTGIPVWDGNA